MCTRTTSVPPALGTQMSPNAFAAGNGLVPTDSVLTTLFVAGSIREQAYGPSSASRRSMTSSLPLLATEANKRRAFDSARSTAA
jgi:hypothetical protein